MLSVLVLRKRNTCLAELKALGNPVFSKFKDHVPVREMVYLVLVLEARCLN